MRIALTANGPGVGTTSIGRILQTFYGFKHINMSDELIVYYARTVTDCEPCAQAMANHIKERRDIKESLRDRLKEYAEKSRWAENYRLPVGYESHPDIVVEKYRTPEQYAYLKALGFSMIRIERIGAQVPSTGHAIYAPYDMSFTSAEDVSPMEVVENLFNWLCDCDYWYDETPQD